MARRPKPWWRSERNAWFVTIRGVQHNLGPKKEAAERLFYELMAKPEPPVIASDSLVSILDLYLAWCEKHRSPGTYDWYRQRLSEFARNVRTLRVRDLRPFHVQEWIDTKDSDGHKRGCITAVQRALNWAVTQGYIEKNPIIRMEKPAAGRREVILSQEEHEAILARCSDQEFRDVLTFAWESGARPQEIFALEARHTDFSRDRCVFPEKESKGKRKKRIIYLAPNAKKILEKLVHLYPTGKLFRNADGEPWHRNNVICRFGRLQIELGKAELGDWKPSEAEIDRKVKTLQKHRMESGRKVEKSAKELRREAIYKLTSREAKKKVPKHCLYHWRHSYCQQALLRGVDPITLAELMGHKDGTMVLRIYQHIHQDDQHLLDAAKKAVG